MSVDIKLEFGEIALGYEDVELVSEEECLLQDIKNKLFTDLGALYYDLSYGANILRYIHSSRDDLTMQELKQAVKISLKSDDRIVQNSISIDIKKSVEGLRISIGFKTIEGNQINTEFSV